MQIVLCAMAKNEHLYINDFVEYYKRLGFDKIYIYNNDDFDKPNLEDYIKNKSKVEIIDIRGIKKPKLQQEIYTIFYNTHKFDWCLFCDIDEYLVGVKNVHLWLEQWYMRNVKQIRIKWKLFGDDDLIERDMSIPVYKAFTKEVKTSLNRNLVDKGNLENQGKAFVRGGLPNVIITSPHFASIKRRDNVIPSILPSGRPCYSKVVINENYSRETIYMNHYMTKTLSEFVKQKLGRNDAVYGTSVPLDYFWRINKKTEDKIKWLEERGIYELQDISNELR